MVLKRKKRKLQRKQRKLNSFSPVSKSPTKVGDFFEKSLSIGLCTQQLLMPIFTVSVNDSASLRSIFALL